MAAIAVPIRLNEIKEAWDIYEAYNSDSNNFANTFKISFHITKYLNQLIRRYLFMTKNC